MSEAYLICRHEIIAHNIVCRKFPPSSSPTMETHSGTGSILGALLAIYAAITQPSVVAQIPGKAGAVLGALGAASPIVTAGIGVVGALIAARSMPPGSAKLPPWQPSGVTIVRDE